MKLPLTRIDFTIFVSCFRSGHPRKQSLRPVRRPRGFEKRAVIPSPQDNWGVQELTQSILRDRCVGTPISDMFAFVFYVTLANKVHVQCKMLL